MAYIEINRPISAIFADLVNQFTALVRKEGQLARAEMSEEIGEIGMALGLVVAGGAAAPSLDDSAAGGGCRLGCGGSCRRLGKSDRRWRGAADRGGAAGHRRQTPEGKTLRPDQNYRATPA